MDDVDRLIQRARNHKLMGSTREEFVSLLVKEGHDEHIAHFIWTAGIILSHDAPE